MKTVWSRGEILGKRMYFLVDLTFAGATWRLSTHVLDVRSDDGWLHYTGTCGAITVSEEVTLFALAATPVSVPFSARLPVDVTALVAQGHALGGCVAEISQWVESTDYEDRRIVMRGRLVDPEYGEDGFLNASIEENLYEDPAVVPPTGWVIEEGRFSDITGTALLGTEDKGLPYPIAIGFPGKDPQAFAGWITGSKMPWMSKATSYHYGLLSYGHVAADQVWLSNDDLVYGEPFVITKGFDDAGLPISYVDRAFGGGGDYFAGFDGLEVVTSSTTFRPTVNTVREIFAGWPDGGGVIGRNGTVVRKAGAVLEYLLDFANVPIDRGRFAVAALQLPAINIDTSIDETCKVWDWISARLLPLLPVSMCSGPAGYFPLVWKPDAPISDVVATIDADVDPRIDVSDVVQQDTSAVANEFTLEYGYSQRKDGYLYTARVGADYIPATNKARAMFVEAPDSAAPQRIVVEAREPGLAGQGILVSFTNTGANPPVETTTLATRTVTLEYTTATSTTAEIADELQTSTLVDAGEETAAVAWDVAFIVDTAQALQLVDNAVLPSALCKLSQARLRNLDRRDDGRRPWSMSTPLIMDKASAYNAVAWRAAAFPLPRDRIEMTVPADEWGWLQRGQRVLFRYARLSMTANKVWQIEALEWSSNGRLGIRLVHVRNPSRDLHAAA